MRSIEGRWRHPTNVLALAGTLFLSACGSGQQNAGAGQRGAGGGTPQVGFVIVQATTAPIVTELSGRVTAFESSDVRPQVTGVIRRRFFTEGQMVRQGQPLYEIDPSLYRAAVNQAEANLQSARANAEAARIQAERYKPLAAIQAVSQQDYTNALAQSRQGAAAVAQNQAALETARVNLRFTTVPAPISGRIGRSLFTVGALATANQAGPLAQIQSLDPMFVDIQRSTSDMLALRQALARSGVKSTQAVVRITLEDGSLYPNTGSVQFSEGLVDPQTGTVTLRARFPNSQGILLPGMFVRVAFAQAINTRAFLVPQQAVARDPTGEATVFLVGPGDKAIVRKVKADGTQGQYWIVTDGLVEGDRVIVQGTGQLRPDQPIKPVPADAPQKLEARPAGGRQPKSS